jgi:hypothetical protein
MHRTNLSILTAIALSLALTAAAAAQPAGDDDDAADATPDDGEAGDDDGEAADDGAAAEAPPADLMDLQALRKEYLRLRDELFRSRARAASVASALYSTKIEIRLDYGTARFYTVDRATIRLDGANIYDDTRGSIADDKAPRFEGYIAPGRHMISIRVEATGKDDGRFKSVIENSFVVQAPAGHDLVIAASAKDGGNIPYKWNKKQRGSYKLHLDVDVEAVKRKASDKKVARRDGGTN